MEDSRKEWLAWRHRGIGGSDAAIVHNVSEWATRFDLGEEKRGPLREEKAANFAQEKGNNREPIARARFVAEYGILTGKDEAFAPRRVEMADYPFMKASLDGASEDLKTIVEFKTMSDPHNGGPVWTPGQIKHLDVENLCIPLTAREGRCRVPFDYWIQMQHQMLVSGAERCYFVSFDGETHKTCLVAPDEDFLKIHFDLCVEFWTLVEQNKAQPISDRDFKKIRVKGAAAKLSAWKREKAKLDAATAKIKVLRAEILEIAEKEGHPRLVCSGVQITKQAGKAGGVDWESAFDAIWCHAEDKGEKREEIIAKFKKADGKPFFKMGAE